MLPPEMQECPRGTMEGKHLGRLDRFRVRRRCVVRVQRSHRRKLSTKSDGALRGAEGRARRRKRASFHDTLKSLFSQFT